MADKPIIFSAPMVCALLDGRKTQTRRVIKNVPDAPPARCAPRNAPKHPAPYLDAYCGERPTSTNPRGMGRNWHWWQIDDRPGPVAFRLPYATGDRLYVREAVCWVSRLGWRYRADDDDLSDKREAGEVGRWHPSIHMPRLASRITLTVTDVRVQRLQEISEADAVAEGCEATGWRPTYGNPDNAGFEESIPAKDAFADLWSSLHGPGAWEANPWVAAYSFTVQRGNIDAPKETPND